MWMCSITRLDASPGPTPWPQVDRSHWLQVIEPKKLDDHHGSAHQSLHSPPARYKEGCTNPIVWTSMNVHERPWMSMSIAILLNQSYGSHAPTRTFTAPEATLPHPQGHAPSSSLPDRCQPLRGVEIEIDLHKMCARLFFSCSTLSHVQNHASPLQGSTKE